MPEGTVDVIPVDLVVGAIFAVAARGPANADGSPDITQVASGSANPLQVRAPRRPGAGLVHRAPALRHRGPADQRARVGLHRSRDGCSASSSGPRSCWTRAERVLAVAPAPRHAGGVVGQGRGEARAGRAGAHLRRALRRVHRVRGDLRRRPPARPARRRSTPRTRPTFDFDPRVIDWDHYVHEIHLPSVVEARPGAHRRLEGPRASRATTACAARSSSPERQHRRVRPREHADRVERRHRRTPGSPSRRLDRDDKLRLAAQAARARRPGLLQARPAPTAATSSATSTGATRTRRVEQLARTPPRCSRDLILTKSFPAAIRRVREHRALGHRTVLITGALDFVVEPLRPLFDDIVARLACRSTPTARYPAQMIDVPPTGESRASALFDYADDPRLRPRRVASPTPTRPATCRCSRSSASRWR